MKGIIFRNIIMAIAVATLCLVSWVGAQEGKSESKIEPKLVYEKRFDFEIGHGKLADDKIFPIILLTKDFDKKGHNRYGKVLFFDENGKKITTLNLTDNQLPVLSEDGRYVGVVSFSKVELYNYTGKMLWRIIPAKNYYPDISIAKNAEGIAISYWTQSAGFACVDFSTKGGEITKTFTAPKPFPADSTPSSDTVLQIAQAIKVDPHWQANPVREFVSRNATLMTVGDHFLCRAKDGKRSWIAIFNANGDVRVLKEFWDQDIETLVMSPDCTRLIFNSRPSFYSRYYQVLKGNAINVNVELYNIPENKQNKIEINTQYGKNAPCWRTFRFSDNGKYFLMIADSELLLGDVQANEANYYWRVPKGAGIDFAVLTTNGNYVLCVLEDGKTVVLDRQGNEIIELESGGKIIDAKITEKEKTIIILKENGVYKYTW